MNPLHSPTELQYFTNIGHWFEGALLGIIAIVTILQRYGYLKGSITRFFIPSLIFIGGVFLSPYMFLHHGLNNVSIVWDFIINDPAQIQHFIMGNLLLAAGITEILITSKVLTNKLWRIVFPLAVVVIGFLFLIHPQHGTGAEFIRASQIHHILGCIS